MMEIGLSMTIAPNRYGPEKPRCPILARFRNRSYLMRVGSLAKRCGVGPLDSCLATSAQAGISVDDFLTAIRHYIGPGAQGANSRSWGEYYLARMRTLLHDVQSRVPVLEERHRITPSPRR